MFTCLISLLPVLPILQILGSWLRWRTKAKWRSRFLSIKAIFRSVDGPHWSRAISSISSYMWIITGRRAEEWTMEGWQKTWPSSLSDKCIQTVSRGERCMWACVCLARASWLRYGVWELRSAGRERHADKHWILLKRYLHVFPSSQLFFNSRTPKYFLFSFWCMYLTQALWGTRHWTLGRTHRSNFVHCCCSTCFFHLVLCVWCNGGLMPQLQFKRIFYEGLYWANKIEVQVFSSKREKEEEKCAKWW